MNGDRTAPADRAEFIERFGGVYEKAPWVAAGCWDRYGGPLVGDQLADGLREVVENANREARLALLRDHPELGVRLARESDLTEQSRLEQQGAGLDRCTPEEFEAFQSLNAAYREKFGFPFILAVRGFGRREILDAFRRRLDNDFKTEFRTALDQVHRIASLRLADLQQ